LIDWVAIQPLIGGMALGAEEALGCPPKEIVSYSELPHEKHLLEYYNKKGRSIPYNIINCNDEYEKTFNIDVAIAVPICSGLSMLNSCSTGEKARGVDAIQNDNMYNVTDLALRVMKVKSFILENAPALATNMGKEVLDNLKKIAADNSYSMTIIKTSTVLHGIPQNRKRTFVIFWNTEFAPSLSFYKRDCPSVENYLKQIPKKVSFKNYTAKDAVLDTNFYYLYLKDKFGKDYRKAIKENNCVTAADYLNKFHLFDEAIDFAKKIGDEKQQRIIERFKRKRSMGMGYWDNSIHFGVKEGYTPAIIGKNMWRLLHPTEERFYNIRELMWLMGLPHDFELLDKKFVNHITQNVPVPAARDWILEIKKFLNNELSFSDSKIVLHDNFKRKPLSNTFEKLY